MTHYVSDIPFRGASNNALIGLNQATGYAGGG
jgi:hypothetical protein